MNALAALFAAIAGLLFARRRRRQRMPARVRVSPRTSTVIAADGAVRSVQSADITLARTDLDRMWTAGNLENLARTYWRFLTRVTLGLIRVSYGHDERSVVFVARPLTLLRFKAPEYSIEDGHGNVRWLIQGGLLVARAGRGCGFLSLDVRRVPDDVSRSDVTAAHPGRGRELLSGDRRRVQHAGVRGHPVGDPRAGHARIPALTGESGPSALQGRQAVDGDAGTRVGARRAGQP